MICNGTKAERSPIRSVIIRVTNKIEAGVRFVYYEYDYRQLDDTKVYYQLIINSENSPFYDFVQISSMLW